MDDALRHRIWFERSTSDRAVETRVGDRVGDTTLLPGERGYVTVKARLRIIHHTRRR